MIITVILLLLSFIIIDYHYLILLMGIFQIAIFWDAFQFRKFRYHERISSVQTELAIIEIENNISPWSLTFLSADSDWCSIVIIDTAEWAIRRRGNRRAPST